MLNKRVTSSGTIRNCHKDDAKKKRKKWVRGDSYAPSNNSRTALTLTLFSESALGAVGPKAEMLAAEKARSRPLTSSIHTLSETRSRTRTHIRSTAAARGHRGVVSRDVPLDTIMSGNGISVEAQEQFAEFPTGILLLKDAAERRPSFAISGISVMSVGRHGNGSSEGGGRKSVAARSAGNKPPSPMLFFFVRFPGLLAQFEFLQGFFSRDPVQICAESMDEEDRRRLRWHGRHSGCKVQLDRRYSWGRWRKMRGRWYVTRQMALVLCSSFEARCQVQ
ncbi:hypothetical protein CEXT_333251 [Caerostris extrusa]|uniref:Uncharacterized protein n=1 Tax=Caerostris extrusa TaxID=172846 RepID=A0AAV4UBS5_CAEEX|nr:hypothetical protein CEXT_333251 [Caerostris extrusa]